MKIISHLIIALVICVGLLSACAPVPRSPTVVKPASVLKVEGSEFSRIVLTEKAFERLGIQTERVQNEIVTRMLTVTGEVIDPLEFKDKVSLKPGQVLVKVFVSDDDFDDIDAQEGAEIATLEDDEDADGLAAELLEQVAEVVGKDKDEQTLFFIVDNPENKMEAGDRVLVDLPVQDSGMQQKVIPYAAIIYGLKGETWVYTNPEPLVYVRELVVIDFIEDDRAVLKEGLDVGVAVVTVGVAELYGTETGVSK